MQKNIELELRAEIFQKDFDEILNRLNQQGKLISETTRLSVMFFSELNNICIDIRVRITNGESEIVIKKGEIHSKDRTEFCQKIANGQFVNMVKIMSQLCFEAKVGERKNFNFQFPDNAIVTLVKAGDLSYIEIEKMTDELNKEKDRLQLVGIANALGVKIIEDKEKFNNFCKRLIETTDWKFDGDKKQYERLEKLLNCKYFC